MSDAAMRCIVVSPERPLFEGTVDRVVVPGSEGEMGIWPRHAPLIGSLGPGVVRLHKGNDVEKYAIRGGFVHVKDDVVTLLVTDAVKASDAQMGSVRAELDSVLEALRHPRSAEEYEELRQRRRWCEVRLALLDGR